MKQEQGTVTLKVGEGPAEKSFSQTYAKQVFETAADVIVWLQDEEKAKKVISALNYGLDLKLRAAVRQQLEATSAGPDKAIAKFIDTLQKARIAAGKEPFTAEVALAKAQALMAAAADD